MDAPVLSTDIAASLLSSVVRIADEHPDVAGRRRAMLRALARAVEADAGFWAWGRGWPDTGSVAPVAMIDFGLDDRKRAILMEWGLDAECNREFMSRIRRRMGEATHMTTIRHDIYSPGEWAAGTFMHRMQRRGGWSSWLHSVRYSDRDTWSNFFLLRDDGRAEFGPRDAAVAHLVLGAVPWLHSTAEETPPPEALVGLTPRQRTVMLMVLDGMSRKAIASRLDISSDTVGDHLKAIYAHVGVGTSSQLAALFLRNR